MTVAKEPEPYLAHYGILRRSGRYPWGSGGTQNVRNRTYLDMIGDLKKKGMTDTEIAKGFGITTVQLRSGRSIALAQQKQARIIQTQRMHEKGMSNSAIARRQGRNESSVRADLAPGAKDKADALQVTSNMLKEQVDKNSYIQVSRGVDTQLGLTSTRLNNAIGVLKEQGYEVHNIKVEQVGTGKYTTMRVLAKPGTTLHEVQRNRAQIKLPFSYSEDNGRSFFNAGPAISVSSRRVDVKYESKDDGVIFVRPGIKDLDLGGNRYGQVRILVDGTHYLKGMAVYKDNLPKGRDLVFNTSKSSTGRKKDVMKPIAEESELPFGSIVRQIHDPKTGKVTSALNIVGSPTKVGSGVEGSWDQWSKTLSTQMLSKQTPDLAKTQLSLTYERRVREFNDINSLTNPSVKKKLLQGFADETDSAAVHLKAASLPRQATKVLLPLSSIKENEAYVPGFRDGERVALIRFPHAGRFEIPEVTVNNRNPEGRKVFGRDAKDVIGIHHSVASHLSGADFDGDTVLVIPNNKGVVKRGDPLESLKTFDPMSYKMTDPSLPRMSADRKGWEMGNISNLITDMTLQGANTEELSRAVRHSMVVIDAEKHELNWKQSEIDHGIRQLKQRYQHRIEDGKRKTGGATLISQKKARTDILERKERPASRGGPIDPVTGKKVYEETGRTYLNKAGKRVPATTTVPRLSIVDDAHKLSSGTVIEGIYADHSNRLKALANTARKESLGLKDLETSHSARGVYKNEVDSLYAKLKLAKSNAPLEAHAQLLAQAKISALRQANHDIEKDELKKIKTYALNEARARTGANKQRISITQREWEAIQAGAIPKTKLAEILNNTDLDHIKKLAMPREISKLTTTQLSRARVMKESGYSEQDIADRLGISLSRLRVGFENA